MTDTGGIELLEREPSLALLADCAAEARRDDGRLVVLGGEAGVGKTALLERFQHELRDARWSWGVCDGLFTPRPLLVVTFRDDDLATDDQLRVALGELARHRTTRRIAWHRCPRTPCGRWPAAAAWRRPRCTS